MDLTPKIIGFASSAILASSLQNRKVLWPPVLSIVYLERKVLEEIKERRAQ